MVFSRKDKIFMGYVSFREGIIRSFCSVFGPALASDLIIFRQTKLDEIFDLSPIRGPFWKERRFFVGKKLQPDVSCRSIKTYPK